MALVISSDDIHYVTGIKVGELKRCEGNGRVWYTRRITITQVVPHSEGTEAERDLTLYSDTPEGLFLDAPE